MRIQSVIFAVITLLLVIGSISTAVFASHREKASPLASITSFDECIRAGNSVAESYPRTCHTPDGMIFTENIASTTEIVQEPKPEEAPAMVKVAFPLPNTKMESPLTITGEARGNWYFEASFPIELFDEFGVMIASGTAQAQGEWMTTDFVPFAATLTWNATTTAKDGTLKLLRDNPSDLPENAGEFIIPVTF